MKRLLFVLLMWSMALTIGLGQVALRTPEQVTGYLSLPQERIFVHLNTSLLLTGEYFYYKVYCMEGGNRSLSKLSKIAYAELVGAGGNIIFRHKIQLQNGVGYGDFFVPTQVESGSYKLIVYTHWMRNGEPENFFQCDVTILNPYLANQSTLRNARVSTADSIQGDGEGYDGTIMAREDTTLPQNGAPLRLILSNEKLARRSKVSLFFKNGDKSNNSKGNYSISVRKKDGIPAPLQLSMTHFFGNDEVSEVKPSPKIGDTIHLPELRGPLFSGKVMAREGNVPVEDVKVSLSIPGEDHLLEIVETDASGNFSLVVPGYPTEEEAILQVLSDRPEKYVVRLNAHQPLDYSKLHFKKIRIDSSFREQILQRSIHNQIENSYFQFRPDSVLTKIPSLFTDHKENEAYLLDDYTRFKTLRETIVEILKDVSFRRVDKDNEAIRIKGFDYANVTDLPPLIMVDGVTIQDNNALLDFDARTIEMITVLRHKLVFGPQVFQGALLLRTKSGKGYEQFEKGGSFSTEAIFAIRPNKNYFVQRYEDIKVTDSEYRLPDDRLQLLWLPNFNLMEEQAQLDFFTSDVTGEFEIHVEGLTQDNQAVSIRKSIYVE